MYARAYVYAHTSTIYVYVDEHFFTVKNNSEGINIRKDMYVLVYFYRSLDVKWEQKGKFAHLSKVSECSLESVILLQREFVAQYRIGRFFEGNYSNKEINVRNTDKKKNHYFRQQLNSK